MNPELKKLLIAVDDITTRLGHASHNLKSSANTPEDMKFWRNMINELEMNLARLNAEIFSIWQAS